jgi:hypothetical protein
MEATGGRWREVGAGVDIVDGGVKRLMEFLRQARRRAKGVVERAEETVTTAR